MIFKFNKNYFMFFLILLGTEIGVLFTKGFIRHTLGDFLIVITIYCFLMSFVKTSYVKAATAVLIFSFCIEFIQLTPFLTYFHLENSSVAKTIFGNTFSIQDLIAYCVGLGFVLLIEIKRR